MLRKIIHINQALCNGCGLCANACHEGAIAMVNGKATLINESYCDGLGACLPECPTGAIEIIEKEAPAFDEEAVKTHLSPRLHHAVNPASGCPGSQARLVAVPAVNKSLPHNPLSTKSALRQWPVQISLVNPDAAYFDDADVLIAADCVAYAYAQFNPHMMQGYITLIGCPKLDDANAHLDKLGMIFSRHNIRSVRVVRMQVPCCGGMTRLVQLAAQQAGARFEIDVITISSQGEIVS